MTSAAQLGALSGIGSDAGWRDAKAGRDARHRIDLLREVGNEEAVDHVERVELELDRLMVGEVELRRDDGLAVRLRIGELERELPRGDVDRDRVLLARLVGAQHGVGVGAERDDQERRYRRPHYLQARVAVDRGSVLQLLAGLHAEVPDRVQDDRHDHHEDRHRRDQQHVVQGPDVPGLNRGLAREPWDDQRDRDSDRRGDHPNDQHLHQRALTHGAVLDLRASLRRASYGFWATNGVGTRTASREAAEWSWRAQPRWIMIAAIVAN